MSPSLPASALIAQLGERQTEDLKAECSIHSQGSPFFQSQGSPFFQLKGFHEFCKIFQFLIWTSVEPC